MSKNQRYLQQSLRERITYDLTLTRMGELNIRNIDSVVRGLLYSLVSGTFDASVFEGLISSPGAGLSVDLTNPASLVQKIDGGDIKYCIDDNEGSDFNVALDVADPTNPRIDILEARIETRSKFTDNTVDIVDPVTQIVTPQSRDRDFEIFLNIQKKTGSPAGSPTAPAPTVASEGSVTGSITTDVIDLSSEYIINIAVGKDSEFVEVDCRGAVPASTTRLERIANLNAAGFGTIATDVGGAIKISGVGVLGENSIVQIKQPLDDTIDAYAEILGGTESDGYFDEFVGSNAFFKICEVFVPNTATSLTIGNVRSRESKDIDWSSGATTLENGLSFEAHRNSAILDHPDGSVTYDKIDPAAISAIVTTANSKITNFRGTNASLYPVNGEPRKGTILLHDIPLVKADGLAEVNTNFEQEFPIHRVDQRQEDITGPTGYVVPLALSEAGADTFPFTQGSAVVSGSNNYTVQFDYLNHRRLGIYINNGGSVTGFTHLRVELHNSTNIQLAFYDIPIADLISVGVGWIYIPLPATLSDATNHYHFHIIGETAPVSPIIALDTSDTNLSFRQMYLPTSGKYGGGSETDVVNLLNRSGARAIPLRTSGIDQIIAVGTGFLGIATGTNYDIMLVDFSNTTFWTNWKYEDYIGIDPVLGRFKFPPSLIADYYHESNINESLSNSDSKNFERHNTLESIEDYLDRVTDRFEGKEVERVHEDPLTTVNQGVNQGMQSILLPDSGTPTFWFDFKGPQNLKSGTISNDFPTSKRVRIKLLFSHNNTSGNVKIDITTKIQGNAGAGTTKTIVISGNTGSSIIEDVILSSELDSNIPIEITISRDNTVGSNLVGDFAVNGVSII